MRDETWEWLLPMAAEAVRQSVDLRAVREQATMPAVEADNPLFDAISGALPGEAKSWSTDWIRFGELLRAAIGWQAIYPADPDTSPAPAVTDDELELAEYGMYLARVPGCHCQMTLEEYRGHWLERRIKWADENQADAQEDDGDE
jgi:hypothetical protein